MPNVAGEKYPVFSEYPWTILSVKKMVKIGWSLKIVSPTVNATSFLSCFLYHSMMSSASWEMFRVYVQSLVASI